MKLSDNSGNTGKRHKDGRSLTYSQRVTKRYGTSNSFPLQVSTVLDIYRLNFYNNLHYILKYTSLSLKSYNSIMKSFGIRGTDRYLRLISKGECLGFDMYYAAALASFFKMPISVIIGLNIMDAGIDLSEYGVVRNSFIKKVPKKGIGEVVLKEPHGSFFARKSITRAASKRAKSPPGLIDAFGLLHNTAGERISHLKDGVC